MSREYMVLLVEDPEDEDVEGQPAQVYMRFTEQPSDEYLQGVAQTHPGKRVYCLMGASTWHLEHGAYDD